MKIPVLLPNIFDHPFTYESDKKAEVGEYVVVPFGKTNAIGVVWDQFEKENPSMHKDNSNDVRLAKEYCEEQSLKYNHKNCKPLWCDDCQLLTGYLVDY